MSSPIEALILDLLEWIEPQPRSYDAVIEVWRTSCPRLPVWEEVNDRGFIAYHRQSGQGEMVSISPSGAAFLAANRTQRAIAHQAPALQ